MRGWPLGREETGAFFSSSYSSLVPECPEGNRVCVCKRGCSGYSHKLTQDPLQLFTPLHLTNKFSLERTYILVELRKESKMFFQHLKFNNEFDVKISLARVWGTVHPRGVLSGRALPQLFWKALGNCYQKHLKNALQPGNTHGEI